MRKLLCVVGPTASGKTGLSVELALRWGGEIVSCDSVQIYKGLDIGSAKPTPEERRGVPHHMLDIMEPTETYSAGRYARDAGRVIDGIFARGGLPIVCGGTGLYLRALTGAMADIPECPRLDHGPDAYKTLMESDPETARRLSPGDAKRVSRALDVFLHTGKPLSAFHAETPAPKYDAVCLGALWEREALYERIERRVDDMLEAGFLDEVRALRAAGVLRGAPAMGSLGYRELSACIDGELSLDSAVRLIKLSTRRYAKRQLTWFRGQHCVQWINFEEFSEKASLVMEKFFKA